MIEQLAQAQHQQNRKLIYSIFAVGGLLSATLLFNQQQNNLALIALFMSAVAGYFTFKK